MSRSSISSSDDGLIVTPPDLASGGRKTLAWLVTGLFLVVCTATSVVDQLFPTDAPKLVGAERVQLEVAGKRARFADGSWARHVESDLRLTSRVRSTFTPFYSYVLYRHLGLVRPVVVLGSDDWLYHRRRAGSAHTAKDAPRIAACSLAAVDRMMAATGIDFTLAPIPRKAVVHPEHLPVGFDHRPELDEELMRELAKHGVNAADLLAVFLADDGGDLYNLTDTHWSQRAEALAADAIARQAEIMVPPAKRLGRLMQQGNAPPGRDLIAFLGIALENEDVDYVMDFLAPRMLEGWNVYEEGELYEFEQREGMSRIALAGTSFSARRKLSRFLSHFAGEVVHNGAKRGGDPSECLALLVTRKNRPESIILEVPNHAFFEERSLTHLGRVFSALVPEKHIVLMDAEQYPIKNRYRAHTRTPNRGKFFTPRASGVIHSGDGIVAWRIRGDVTGAGATIQANNEFRSLTLPWKPGQSELFVPLIHDGLTAGSTNLFVQTNPHAETPGEIRIDSIELVALLSEDGAVRGEPGEISRSNGEWSQDIRFPAGDVVPDHAGVLIELDFKGRRNPVVRFDVRSADATEPAYQVRGRHPRSSSRVVLNLARFAGEPMPIIRVRGGGSPEEVVASASLHPLQ